MKKAYLKPKKRTVAKQASNELRKIRKLEGLKMTELAVEASVSTKTIQVIEYRTRPVSSEIKHKIVNALNGRSKRRQEYTFKAIFPHDSEF